MVQHDRVREDHDCQQEVEGDEIGIELEEHDKATKHDLSRDAGNQSRAEQGEVPARRRPESCHGEGDDRHQRDCCAHEPVGEFHHRVERGHGRQVVLEARGPVGAAKPGACQPHRTAAQHQQTRNRPPRPRPPCARWRASNEAGAPPSDRMLARLKPPFCTAGSQCRRGLIDCGHFYTCEMAQVTTVSIPRRSASFKLRAYVALTKPRIIELLLVTTLPTMVVAARAFLRGG